MNLWDSRMRCQYLEKSVSDASRIGSTVRCFTQHLPDQGQDMWNGAESVLVIPTGSLL
jgi:hypothetical protein